MQRVGEEIAAHLRRVRNLGTDTVLLELRGTTPGQMQGVSTWLAREVRPRVE